MLALTSDAANGQLEGTGSRCEADTVPDAEVRGELRLELLVLGPQDVAAVVENAT